MRVAYSGRAAAYEKKGDHEHALADHNMVVLFYALEAEVLKDLEAPSRDKFLVEAAQAYRARGVCQERLGRQTAAQADRKRADALDATAKELGSNATKAKAPAGEIRLINGWAGGVITVVVDGVSYRLEAGEQRTIAAPANSVPYEMQAGQHRVSGTLQAGKTYTIQ
jgi:hypothetical protein